MFTCPVLDVYLLRPFFQEGCVELLTSGFMVTVFAFVSLLLLQAILPNTLGLTRPLVQGRNDTARKGVHFKHPVKESFWKHGPLMWTHSSMSMWFATEKKVQWKRGLLLFLPPSPSQAVYQGEQYPNLDKVQNNLCSTFCLEMGDAATLQRAPKSWGGEARGIEYGVEVLGPVMAPETHWCRREHLESSQCCAAYLVRPQDGDEGCACKRQCGPQARLLMRSK